MPIVTPQLKEKGLFSPPSYVTFFDKSHLPSTFGKWLSLVGLAKIFKHVYSFEALHWEHKSSQIYYPGSQYKLRMIIKNILISFHFHHFAWYKKRGCFLY